MYSRTRLPTDAQERKNIPMATGLLDYFPDALAAVADLSRVGNDQHNPGEPLHWAKEKSTDHADCVVRHLVERGTVDTDGVRHSTKAAWRALALLQIELEEEGDGVVEKEEGGGGDGTGPRTDEWDVASGTKGEDSREAEEYGEDSVAVEHLRARDCVVCRVARNGSDSSVGFVAFRGNRCAEDDHARLACTHCYPY